MRKSLRQVRDDFVVCSVVGGVAFLAMYRVESVDDVVDSVLVFDVIRVLYYTSQKTKIVSPSLE